MQQDHATNQAVSFKHTMIHHRDAASLTYSKPVYLHLKTSMQLPEDQKI